MGTQSMALESAYVKLASSSSYSATTTYLEAGQVSGSTYTYAIAAMYFGDLSAYNLKTVSFHICRQDTYAAHTLTVSAASSYAADGTSLGTWSFASGSGTWTTVDLTSHIATLQAAPWIKLSHGSGSSWSSFYKTGANAPYLSVETQDGAMYYYTGTAWVPCTVHYYDGSAWQQCIPYYYDGTAWKECGV